MTNCPWAMLNACEHLKMITKPMAIKAYIIPSASPVMISWKKKVICPSRPTVAILSAA